MEGYDNEKIYSLADRDIMKSNLLEVRQIQA